MNAWQRNKFDQSFFFSLYSFNAAYQTLIILPPHALIHTGNNRMSL